MVRPHPISGFHGRWLLALAALAASAGPASSVSSAMPAACESHAPRTDRRDIICALNAPTADQRLRFRAHFSGSHDDTMAAMTLTLDGAPLACDPGSKTYLEGEEGDVALECRFSIAPGAGATRSVRALLSWHHAEYTRFELVAE